MFSDGSSAAISVRIRDPFVRGLRRHGGSDQGGLANVRIRDPFVRGLRQLTLRGSQHRTPFESETRS